MSPLAEGLLAASLMCGANYADYATTKQGLSVPGTHEANPLIGAEGQRLEVVKISVTAAEVGIYQALRRRGHRRAAWVWVASVVAVNVGLAVHNSRQKGP